MFCVVILQYPLSNDKNAPNSSAVSAKQCRIFAWTLYIYMLVLNVTTRNSVTWPVSFVSSETVWTKWNDFLFVLLLLCHHRNSSYLNSCDQSADGHLLRLIIFCGQRNILHKHKDGFRVLHPVTKLTLSQSHDLSVSHSHDLQ